MGASSRPSVSNEDVVATYDRIAPLYDWFVASLEAKTRKRALDLLSVDGDDRIVEIGCGPGHALVSFASLVDRSGRVIGVDAAPGMIARARDRASESRASDRIELLLGDARSLPLVDDTADVVFVEDTLELFSEDEIGIAIEESKRILDADGRIGVVTMERENAEIDPFFRGYEWAFEHIPGYDRVGCRPIYARRILEGKGFTIERRERHRRGYVWPVEILIGRPA